MNVKNGYVVVGLQNRKATWAGRTSRIPDEPSEPFEAMIAGASSWTLHAMPKPERSIHRMLDIPFIADTLLQVWAWVSGDGRDLEIAAVADGGVRGIALRKPGGRGRVAILAQCEEQSP